MASQIKLGPFLASILLMLFLIQMAVVQAASETVVKVEPHSSSASVGETFTINITVLDVQNLYGLEVALYWNASVLRVVSIDLRLGVESHSDGVLHESPSAIFVAENNVTQEQGKYRLAATSTAPAPSFNGSGNMVRITFNLTNSGSSKLDLETQLWDYPPPNQPSSPIEHVTIDGFFGVIPEFPNIIILFIFMVIAIFVIIFSKKILQKTWLTTI